MMPQTTEIQLTSPCYTSPPPSTTSFAQQPLQQSSPFHMAQYNPYYPMASPTTTHQYVMYPNYWNSMYDLYGNTCSYTYPTNPATSSTGSESFAIPPLPLDSPPKNPPLPKDIWIENFELFLVISFMLFCSMIVKIWCWCKNQHRDFLVHDILIYMISL